MRGALPTSARTALAAHAALAVNTGITGRRGSAALRVLGAIVALGAWLGDAAAALADSPTPSQAAAGDPRAGQAAGFVGDPGLSILIVALIIAASVVVTMAWVRATGGRAGTGDRGD
ncbi:MAG TPA: hypothetical protein VIR16_11470 [Candidatus Limnocylindrales bacterium]